MFYGFLEPKQRLSDCIILEADSYNKAVDLFDYNFPDFKYMSSFYVLLLGQCGIISSDIRVLSYLPKRRRPSEER